MTRKENKNQNNTREYELDNYIKCICIGDSFGDLYYFLNDGINSICQTGLKALDGKSQIDLADTGSVKQSLFVTVYQEAACCIEVIISYVNIANVDGKMENAAKEFAGLVMEKFNGIVHTLTFKDDKVVDYASKYPETVEEEK